MGCCYSRIEREEMVSRCKARKRYMKQFVKARQAPVCSPQSVYQIPAWHWLCSPSVCHRRDQSPPPPSHTDSSLSTAAHESQLRYVDIITASPSHLPPPPPPPPPPQQPSEFFFLREARGQNEGGARGHN